MSLQAPLGIFGGTFDPIHNGHIFPILEAAQQTGIKSIAMMPNFLAGHKHPAQSSSVHRLAMVKLVCEQYPIFYPEPWEIEQAVVSYSVDTLHAFRQRYPDTPLCFFIGSDSLYSLPTWHRWQELLTLCHFVVCQRQYDLTHYQTSPHWPVVQQLLAQHQVSCAAELHQQLAGCIYLAKTTEINLSSSQIRAQLAAKQCPADVLPSAIYQYIEQYKLYQQSANI
ncbi:nicotinate-nucleotide adenylyltransferase [Paraglaciecola sp.]|uniref:nicotinate-nucleotide adenylyltransferase n=1 Tax=Paraglaciecola sp. TaxID=1920173 RepID=UPI0030F37B9F